MLLTFEVLVFAKRYQKVMRHSTYKQSRFKVIVGPVQSISWGSPLLFFCDSLHPIHFSVVYLQGHHARMPLITSLQVYVVAVVTF
jgi:hypothetical protein